MKEEEARHMLAELMENASRRKEPLEHILLCGKMSLRSVLPKIEAAHYFHRIVGMPDLRFVDLAAILTHLRERDILLIEQLHRLPTSHSKDLSRLMATFILHIEVGKEPNIKMVDLRLPPFTLLAVTPLPGQLPAQMRGSFKREIYVED